MTLPLFGIILAGLFEFALLFQARGELAEATRAGARLASLPGVSAYQVEEEVRRILSPRLQETMQLAVEPGSRTGDVVTVAIAINMNTASSLANWIQPEKPSTLPGDSDDPGITKCKSRVGTGVASLLN